MMMLRWLRKGGHDPAASAPPTEDELNTPIWADAPEDAGEKLAELMRQVSEAVIEPPKPPDPFSHLSPHERQVLEALLEVNTMTVSEIASLLQSDRAHAYEVMIALAEKGYAAFKTEGEEKAIVSKVASLEEVQEGRWQCAGCHAFLSVDEIAFGICPHCGSNAFWAP
jgi:DNA-binding MarR family transcriptional regulator